MLDVSESVLEVVYRGFEDLDVVDVAFSEASRYGFSEYRHLGRVWADEGCTDRFHGNGVVSRDDYIGFFRSFSRCPGTGFSCVDHRQVDTADGFKEIEEDAVEQKITYVTYIMVIPLYRLIAYDVG